MAVQPGSRRRRRRRVIAQGPRRHGSDPSVGCWRRQWRARRQRVIVAWAALPAALLPPGRAWTACRVGTSLWHGETAGCCPARPIAYVPPCSHIMPAGAIAADCGGSDFRWAGGQAVRHMPGATPGRGACCPPATNAPVDRDHACALAAPPLPGRWCTCCQHACAHFCRRAGPLRPVAEREAERRQLWSARHSAYYAALALRPGARKQPNSMRPPSRRPGQFKPVLACSPASSPSLAGRDGMPVRQPPRSMVDACHGGPASALRLASVPTAN